MPFSIQSFPRAILHVDGDAFFSSCETAMNPSLRGKPVITGKERGIVASLSYEAKARGVKRGMIISEARRVCPEAVILSSDYETYSLFSKRMFSIVRRYTPDVEEYSIDECFADLTGLRRSLNMPYERAASKIKQDLEGELGMTFSVGLGPNKSIAKLGSKWKKPSGLTIIPAYAVHHYLKEFRIDRVWGIGRQTSAFLAKYGIRTAYDLALKPERWVEDRLSKPYREIWQELRGKFVMPLSLEEKHDYQSISKTKTFTPPSTDKNFIFSQLCKNAENACTKMRRHGLATKKIFFYLKTQEFRHHGLEITLAHETAVPNELIRLIGNVFDEVYKEGRKYRATGIVLMDLFPEGRVQQDLFGATAGLEKWRRVYATVDMLDGKYGKHTVFLASTFTALKKGTGKSRPSAVRDLFNGENARQRVHIPMLGQVG
ncbi:MAG: DNA polymerase IV [Patescibacteria group bacterium]|nr:DNA polymerase IV [Patescibacteria group bacterium]